MRVGFVRNVDEPICLQAPGASTVVEDGWLEQVTAPCTELPTRASPLGPVQRHGQGNALPAVRTDDHRKIAPGDPSLQGGMAHAEQACDGRLADRRSDVAFEP